MLKIDKNRVLAPKMSQGFRSLYGLSGHFVLCVLARSALVLVLHRKMAKTVKRAITCSVPRPTKNYVFHKIS